MTLSLDRERTNDRYTERSFPMRKILIALAGGALVVTLAVPAGASTVEPQRGAPGMGGHAGHGHGRFGDGDHSGRGDRGGHFGDHGNRGDGDYWRGGYCGDRDPGGWDHGGWDRGGWGDGFHSDYRYPGADPCHGRGY
jgi:hypothetical protein